MSVSKKFVVINKDVDGFAITDVSIVVEVGTHHVNWYNYSSKQLQVLGYGCYSSDQAITSGLIQSILEKDNPLHSTDARYIWVEAGTGSIQIPNGVYDSERDKDYLKLNFGSPVGEPAKDQLVGTPAHNLYTISPVVAELVSTYTNSEVRHVTTGLIELLYDHSSSALSLLYTTEDMLYLLVKSDNRLQLANQFETSNIDDYSYFLLYGHEQLNVEKEQHQIAIAGSRGSKETLQRVANFSNNVSLYPDFERMKFPAQTVDAHKIQLLGSLACTLCA